MASADKSGTFSVDLDLDPFKDAIRKVGRNASGIGIAFEAADGIADKVAENVEKGIGDFGSTGLEALTEYRASHLQHLHEDIAFVVLIDEAIAARSKTEEV